MKILVMETEFADLRAKAIGWSHEDTVQAAALVVECNYNPPHSRIGEVRTWPCDTTRPTFAAPLYALAAGWRLLGPPVTTRHSDGTSTTDWWFTSDR